MGELKRVVGKDAASPWCHDILFAVAFIAQVIVICVLFFMWVGEGAPGLPSEDTMETAQEMGEAYANTTLTAMGQATAMTFLYAIIFSTVWVFIYLGIMKVAALALIVTLNLLMICAMLGFGLYFLNYANTCKDIDEYPGACTDSDQGAAAVGGIIFCVCALLHLLWMICVRNRIKLTATMLAAVAHVVALCPGIVLISYLMALIACIWTLVWMGAFVQANIMLAGGIDSATAAWSSETLGSFVGLMFVMLISFFWAYKLLQVIATMATAHVVASWYFSPEVVTEGMPCLRPVTLVGLKRACTNYLGSIAFGTLIVAILEALYYTIKYCASKMAGDNMVVKLVVSCVLCVLGCLKKTIEWLTEWAYVFIALYGCSFFTAGGKVVNMLMESGMGALAQSTLIEPVMLVGRLLGGCAGVAGGYVTLSQYDINYEWTQPIMGFLVAFSLSSVALSCVGAGNKAIFICYIDFPEYVAARLPDVATTFNDFPGNKIKNGGGASGGDAGASGVDVEIKP